MVRDIFYYYLTETCALCLQRYSYGSSPIVQLSCEGGHIFHFTCYKQLYKHSPTQAERCPICRQSIHQVNKISSLFSLLIGAIANATGKSNYRTTLVEVRKLEQHLDTIYRQLLTDEGELSSAELMRLLSCETPEQLKQLRQLLFRIFHFNLEQSYQIVQYNPTLLNQLMQQRLVDLFATFKQHPSLLLSQWLGSNMDYIVQMQQHIPELQTMNIASVIHMIQAQDSSGLAAWLQGWIASTPLHTYQPMIESILNHIQANKLKIDDLVVENYTENLAWHLVYEYPQGVTTKQRFSQEKMQMKFSMIREILIWVTLILVFLWIVSFFWMVKNSSYEEPVRLFLISMIEQPPKFIKLPGVLLAFITIVVAAIVLVGPALVVIGGILWGVESRWKRNMMQAHISELSQDPLIQALSTLSKVK